MLPYTPLAPDPVSVTMPHCMLETTSGPPQASGTMWYFEPCFRFLVRSQLRRRISMKDWLPPNRSPEPPRTSA